MTDIALSLGVEDMHLRPGAQLYMRLADPSQAQARYPVEFIGAIKGKSLLFTVPVSGGQELWMPAGHEYVFHAVEGMYIYAFSSRVLLARQRPHPYVHFTWPDQVSARQVRKAYRVRLREPVSYLRANGDACRALLLDLSMTGCQIETSQPDLAVEDRITFQLPLGLEESDRQLSLAAIVRNRSEKGASPVILYGLQFDEPPQEDALLLHYYIDHAIAARLG